MNLRTEPIAVTAGPHRVSAAFIRRLEGPAQDLISPLEWSLASTSIADAYGFTTLPHLRDLAITGPFDVDRRLARRRAGRRSSPAARSTAPQQMRVRATDRLARSARRRSAAPVTERDLNALMALYKTGAAEGGFEAGVRMALEGILASPRFVFRFEERPAAARAGAGLRGRATSTWRRGCRSSCGPPAPDDELLRARRGRPAVDAGGARAAGPPHARRSPRPTRSPRASRAQWLRLQDLDKINPDVRTYPGLRRAAQGVDAPRDRAVLPPHRPRGPAGARPVHGRLHVRRRAARAGTTGSRTSSATSSGRCSIPTTARRGLLGARQHPDADLARRPHLAGAARQVGDGSAARHAAAAAAARRAGPRSDARKPKTAGCAPCASAWSSTARARRARRATA